MKMDKSKKQYIISIAIALATGLISGLLSMGGMMQYEQLNQPKLSPPGFIFPIVWAILYILMGISAAWIYQGASSKARDRSLILYALQLFVNFFWSIFFFAFHLYGFSFFWLILLIILVIAMIISFYSVSPKAALLQLPYLVWLSFAAYLNYMIWSLN